MHLYNRGICLSYWQHNFSHKTFEATPSKIRVIWLLFSKCLPRGCDSEMLWPLFQWSWGSRNDSEMPLLAQCVWKVVVITFYSMGRTILIFCQFGDELLPLPGNEVTPLTANELSTLSQHFIISSQGIAVQKSLLKSSEVLLLPISLEKGRRNACVFNMHHWIQATSKIKPWLFSTRVSNQENVGH